MEHYGQLQQGLDSCKQLRELQDTVAVHADPHMLLGITMPNASGSTADNTPATVSVAPSMCYEDALCQLATFRQELEAMVPLSQEQEQPETSTAAMHGVQQQQLSDDLQTTAAVALATLAAGSQQQQEQQEQPHTSTAADSLPGSHPHRQELQPGARIEILANLRNSRTNKTQALKVTATVDALLGIPYQFNSSRRPAGRSNSSRRDIWLQDVSVRDVTYTQGVLDKGYQPLDSKRVVLRLDEPQFGARFRGYWWLLRPAPQPAAAAAADDDAGDWLAAPRDDAANMLQCIQQLQAAATAAATATGPPQPQTPPAGKPEQQVVTAGAVTAAHTPTAPEASAAAAGGLADVVCRIRLAAAALKTAAHSEPEGNRQAGGAAAAAAMGSPGGSSADAADTHSRCSPAAPATPVHGDQQQEKYPISRRSRAFKRHRIDAF